jgi:penicillin G amidase
MRLLKKIIVWLFFILLGAAILLYIYFQFQKPIYSGKVELSNLDSTVVTYFDEQGVPHIYGNKEEDVFYVLGYLHAKERLFQMELVRRVSSGRLSEIFGSKTLEADKFFRMLGLEQRAEESVRAFKLSPDTLWKRDMIAYLDGVNLYIERKRKRFEFLLLNLPKEEFTLKDMYLIAEFMAFNFQMAFRTDPLMSRIEKKHGKEYLADLGIKIPEQESDSSVVVNFDSVLSSIEEILPVKIWSGSNSWAVSAERSKSGKTLFENDTHIGVQQPAVWYEPGMP